MRIVNRASHGLYKPRQRPSYIVTFDDGADGFISHILNLFGHRHPIDIEAFKQEWLKTYE